MTSPMSTKTRRSARPITASPNRERIAERAYARWQARGCPISDGLDDWFAAQAELERERPKRARSKSAATSS
jgi:hypothetical protein